MFRRDTPARALHNRRVAKSKSLDEIERMRAKAIRFVADVLGDEDRAAEIEAESPEDYAARKKISIINPKRGYSMARTIQSYKDEIEGLKDEISELEDTNEELETQLDEISEIISPEEQEEDETGDGDDSGD
jgi:predicted RNase H-like nuclease (RuvC/YqgF family)